MSVLSTLLTFFTVFEGVFGGHGECDDSLGWQPEPQCGEINGFPAISGKMVSVDDEYLFHVFGWSYECFNESECDHIYYNSSIFRYDIDDNVWSLLNPLPSNAINGLPNGRVFLGATKFDENNDCNKHNNVCPSNSIVIYGGVDYDVTFTDVTVYNDFWFYSIDDNTWTLIEPNMTNGISPGYRIGAQIVSVGDCIYLFGGTNAFFQPQNDFYKYCFDTNEWSLINAINDGPPGRYIFIMLYDEDNDEIIVTTGSRSPGGTQWGDLWKYNVDNNEWSEIDNGTLVPRTHNAGAYDKNGNVIIAFGDINDDETECKVDLAAAGQSPTDETFVYSLNENAWIQQRNFGLISPRLKRVAFAQTDEKLYVLGGFNFVCPASQLNGSPIFNRQLYSLDIETVDLQ